MFLCFFAKTEQQSIWISSVDFLHKRRTSKNKTPKKGKISKKECLSKKGLIGHTVVFTTKKIRKLEGTMGESGYRSRYLPPPKRALYLLG